MMRLLLLAALGILVKAQAQDVTAPFILMGPTSAPVATPYALVDTARYAAETAEIVLPVNFGTDGNRFALVMIADQYGTISAVSGGGQSGSLIRINNNGGLNVRAYGITNPSSGTGSVTVTFDGSTAQSVTVYTFSGVDQSTPTSQDLGASGTNNTPSRSMSSTSDYVVDCVQWESGPASVGADQTAISNMTSPFSNGSSHERGTGSTVTMSWTLSWGSQAWNTIAVTVNPDSD